MIILYYLVLIYIQNIKIVILIYSFDRLLKVENKYYTGVSFATARLGLLIWLLDEVEYRRIKAEERLNYLYFKLSGID